ncbi:DUF6214 family protein [Streptomyces sp. FXJ1.172]|nr:DUF6214 family protein [Streptomyces sp. FXJ1.172]WEP00419.1 DUF6214 family protein [Streptomyces sp. FXJ1.172]
MSVWPAWEVREHGGTLSWFHLRLSFPDGAGVDALAVVREGRVSIEDVRAEPALSLADLSVLADWIQGPLFASCGVTAERTERTEGREEEREEGAFAGAGEGWMTVWRAGRTRKPSEKPAGKAGGRSATARTVVGRMPAAGRGAAPVRECGARGRPGRVASRGG